MDGVYYLIAVCLLIGVLCVIYTLSYKRENERQMLQKERDKKVIALCDYLMSEPNYEKGENDNGESICEELRKE